MNQRSIGAVQQALLNQTRGIKEIILQKREEFDYAQDHNDVDAQIGTAIIITKLMDNLKSAEKAYQWYLKNAKNLNRGKHETKKEN